MDHVGLIQAANKMEKELEYRKWVTEIPYIQWPDWQVKAIPSYLCAIVRYWIKKNDTIVSVYLDCYDMLGAVGEPYWEVYPLERGDVGRCKMNNVTELLSLITQALQGG